MRVKIKIGDVFSVNIDESNKKFFQYIVSDLSQLNSDVIRVFKKIYPISSNPELLEIVTDEVEFYAHCVTKLGIKMGYWDKIGNIIEVGNFHDVVFRTPSHTFHRLNISYDWWVWKINEEFKHIGKLEGEYKKSEIGSVIPPDSIVYRMKNGKYDFVYPDFE